MHDLQPRTVLLVEDDPHVMSTLADMLRELGRSKVLTATDGREALALMVAQGDLVDLVVADWNMPRVTGLELLARVRAIDPDLAFLMLTGRGDAQSVMQAKGSGVTAYLKKPFSLEQLRLKLSMLSKHGGDLAQRRLTGQATRPNWNLLDAAA